MARKTKAQKAAEFEARNRAYEAAYAAATGTPEERAAAAEAAIETPAKSPTAEQTERFARLEQIRAMNRASDEHMAARAAELGMTVEAYRAECRRTAERQGANTAEDFGIYKTH